MRFRAWVVRASDNPLTGRARYRVKFCLPNYAGRLVFAIGCCCSFPAHRELKKGIFVNIKREIFNK